MPGGRVDETALVRVVDGVGAGGDLVGVDLGGEAVEQLQDLVRREVQSGVGADRGAQLAHDGRRAYPAAHDVADDQGGAAAAEGDDVVPVAADRGLGAAGVVGGGDAQIVRLLQFLREQGALEGDGGLALAAFAGAEAFGGLGVVGDVGGEDEDAAGGAGAAESVDRGAGEGVRAAAGGLAGLDRAGPGAAQHLVEERQQAEGFELGHDLARGSAGGAFAERGGPGAVDVREVVVGALDQGDEGRDAVEDLVGREAGDGGGGRGGAGEVLGAGRGHGAVAPWRGEALCSVLAAARRCVPGSRALQRVKFTG